MEILNSFQAVVGHTWGIEPLGLIFGLAFMVGGMAVIVTGILDADVFTIGAVVTGALIMTLGLCVILSCCSEGSNIYETQYQIVLNDDFNVEEFYSKYEVVSQEGKILTVREIS